MKLVDGWWWPDGERHMIEWMASPKNRKLINGRSAYQGKKQLAVLHVCRQRGLLGGLAVDIGAHIGLWSFNLAAAFQHVHAFEPVEDHRACFAENVKAENVTLHAVALGAEAGSVNIRVNAQSTGDSWVSGDGDIPMRTIDSFGLSGVGLVKIDAEGYEENICKGAEATLRVSRPVVIVEQKRDMAVKFGLRPQGAVTWLQSLGYAQHAEIGGDYIMVPA